MKEGSRILIYQETLPDYRIPFLNALGEDTRLLLVYGHSTPIKAVSPDLSLVRNFEPVALPRKGWLNGLISLHQGLFPLIRQFRPEVIISEPRLGLLGVWKLAFSPLSRKKLVWWLSGHEPTENALKSAFRRSLRKIIYCRASAFIVYGSAGKKYLESLGIKKKIFIAYNAVGTAEIETVKKNWIEREEGLESLKPFRSALPHSLLYIGRLSHGKRADLLPEIILALDELSGSQQFGLIVIGDGPALNAVKEKSRRLGLEERIVFTGAIQGIENTGPFFLAADLLLLPGKGGLAINEAVQYGLPVVVGKADGTEEDLVIPGKNGAIILSEHPRDFAEAILRITAKPESVSEMKQASLEIAECIANTSRMKEGFMNAIAVIIESRHNEV